MSWELFWWSYFLAWIPSIIIAYKYIDWSAALITFVIGPIGLGLSFLLFFSSNPKYDTKTLYDNAYTLNLGNGYNTPVAGTSNYQKQIAYATGELGKKPVDTTQKYPALLFLSNTNKHDANAVMVFIMSYHVGYLKSDEAQIFRKECLDRNISNTSFKTSALLVGGGHGKDIGIRLNYSWPKEKKVKLKSKSTNSALSEDFTQQLERLGKLKEKGLLSDEEYQKSKASLLDKL